LLGAIGPAVTAAHVMGADETRMRHTIGTVMSLLPASAGRLTEGIADDSTYAQWELNGNY
jgi:hypothetical protein